MIAVSEKLRFVIVTGKIFTGPLGIKSDVIGVTVTVFLTMQHFEITVTVRFENTVFQKWPLKLRGFLLKKKFTK